jgi:hypothetical protein
VIRAFTCHNRNDISNVQPNKPIIFDTMISNYGSGYNPSTGIFTADKFGWYTFFYDIRVIPGNNLCYIDLVRNGARISTIYAYSSESASHYISESNLSFIHLNVGDRVWLYSKDTGNHVCSIDDFSSFAGFLLNVI